MTDAWLPDLSRGGGAKYQAIAAALDAAVARGQLRPGDRLPPQREVAARLGVDLTTVTRAYEAARSRGLIEARGRAGSFVAGPAPDAPPPPAIDTGMNMPPEIPDGLLRRAITESTAALLAGGGMNWLHYAPAGGTPQDRAAGAALLSARGLASAEEQVIVSAGGQNALHAILSTTLRAGDTVACGQFVYPGFRALAERLGLILLPLPRLDAAAIEAACSHGGSVQALYVVPTNDNPTTVTLREGDREAIALTARRHDLQVIEDDAYGLLAHAPIRPIAAFAPERSWYVASLSKIITPALRVAYVRAPSVAGALRLAADMHETAIMAPPLNAAMATRWLADGTFERLVTAMRAEIAWRQELADSLLGDVARQRSAEGYHLWLPLPDQRAADDLVSAMQLHGLSVIAAARFAVGSGGGQAVRVSLGGPGDRERLARVLRVLHGYVSQPTGKAMALV
ncbi:MAG: PLP-dependent aminotransferase family protein [Pseudomonadota bacterium]